MFRGSRYRGVSKNKNKWQVSNIPFKFYLIHSILYRWWLWSIRKKSILVLYRMNLMLLGIMIISQSFHRVSAQRLTSSTPLPRSSRSFRTTTSSPKTAPRTRTTLQAATLSARTTTSFFNRSMYSRIKECNQTETLAFRWSISSSRTICTDQLLWISKVSSKTWTSRTSLKVSPSSSISSSSLKCTHSSSSNSNQSSLTLTNNNKYKPMY
jgi:hypothetical protein